MANLALDQKKLPILEAMLEAIPLEEVPSFQEIAFVCVQHLLFTTLNLMECLVRLGAHPDNIHIMGKSYSSCPKVADMLIEKGYNYYPNTQQEKLSYFAEFFQQDIECMWKKVYEDLRKKKIKLIVILDDGGMCLTNVPHFISDTYPLVGVEQTTSGLTNLLLRELSFPIVEVASSAAKQLVESPMIAEAVIKKLEDVLPMDGESRVCAVVGLGSIGRAITQKLISLNHKVMIYDKDLERTQAFDKAIPTTSIEALLYEADYIFGCSGKDITKNLEIKYINKEKTFISCSSQDKEFLTLLQMFEKNNCSYQNALDHLECKLNNHNVKIFRGGFPINLDNSGESVAAEDIQLTRGLLLGGILQGVLCAFSHSIQTKVCYMLHPAIQRFVVSQWRFYGSTFLFSQQFLDMFQNISWIKEKSRGTYVENELLEKFYYEKLSPDLVNSNRDISSKRLTA